MLRSFIGIRDTSEVLDDAFSSLLVESLNVSALTYFQGSIDEAFVEGDSAVIVDLLGEISVLRVGGDEGNEADLAGHAEQL